MGAVQGFKTKIVFPTKCLSCLILVDVSLVLVGYSEILKKKMREKMHDPHININYIFFSPSIKGPLRVFQ